MHFYLTDNERRAKFWEEPKLEICSSRNFAAKHSFIQLQRLLCRLFDYGLSLAALYVLDTPADEIVHHYSNDHKERAFGCCMSGPSGNNQQRSCICRALVGLHVLEDITTLRINVRTQLSVG